MRFQFDVEQNQDNDLLPIDSQIDSEDQTSQKQQLTHHWYQNFFVYRGFRNSKMTKTSSLHSQNSFCNYQQLAANLENNFSKHNLRKIVSDREIPSRESTSHRKIILEEKGALRKLKSNRRSYDSNLKPKLDQLYKNYILQINAQNQEQEELGRIFQQIQETSCQNKQKFNSKQMFSKIPLISLNQTIQSSYCHLNKTLIKPIQRFNFVTLAYTRNSNPYLLNWINKQYFLLGNFYSLYLLSRKGYETSQCMQRQSQVITAIDSIQNFTNICGSMGKSSIYDIERSMIIENFEFSKSTIYCANWKNRNIFAVGKQDGLVICDKRGTSKSLQKQLNLKNIQHVKWSTSGSYLSASSQKNLMVWDIKHLSKPIISISMNSQITGLDWFPNTNLFGISSGHQMLIYDCFSDQPLKSIKSEYQVSGLKFCGKSSQMITIHKGSHQNTCTWSLPKFWRTNKTTQNSQHLISLLLNKEESEFATMSSERIITIWQMGGPNSLDLDSKMSCDSNTLR